jgi:hypothetical protein
MKTYLRLYLTLGALVFFAAAMWDIGHPERGGSEGLRYALSYTFLFAIPFIWLV